MKNLNIILINGKAGAGKDTIAVYLKHNYNCSHLYYAFAVKKSLAIITGLDEKYFFDVELKEKQLPYPWDNFTPRKMMQTYGQLVKLQFDESVWVKSVASKISSILEINEDNVNVVISDLRFNAELYIDKFINNKNYTINKIYIIVERPGKDGNTAGGIENHISENGINEFPLGTILINNNKDYWSLYENVDEIMKLYKINPVKQIRNLNNTDIALNYLDYIPRPTVKQLFNSNYIYE